MAHEEVSVRNYVVVFSVLLVLTALTVAVYQVHLGAWNLVVAVIIATMKAALVVVVFMHMAHEARFNALVFLGSLLFAGIFLAYTLNDTERRMEVDEYHGALVDPETGDWAYGVAEQLSAIADRESGARTEEAREADLETLEGAAPAAGGAEELGADEERADDEEADAEEASDERDDKEE